MCTRLLLKISGLPQLGTANFDAQYIRKRHLRQGRSFSGPENKILHFESICPKTDILGRFSVGQWLERGFINERPLYESATYPFGSPITNKHPAYQNIWSVSTQGEGSTFIIDSAHRPTRRK